MLFFFIVSPALFSFKKAKHCKYLFFCLINITFKFLFFFRFYYWHFENCKYNNFFKKLSITFSMLKIKNGELKINYIYIYIFSKIYPLSFLIKRYNIVLTKDISLATIRTSRFRNSIVPRQKYKKHSDVAIIFLSTSPKQK